MAQVTFHFHRYGDPVVSSSAYLDSCTFSHVDHLLSGQWKDIAEKSPDYFARALMDLALFCDVFCVRDDVCHYLPQMSDATPRPHRHFVEPAHNLISSPFASELKGLTFMDIDEAQRSRIFSRWSELARSEYSRRRPAGLPLASEEIQELLLGLLIEEMLASSVYIPGSRTIEAYLDTSPAEVEFRTHNLLTSALNRIDSAFARKTATRAALSGRQEPSLPPILAMILAKVSTPAEIPEELLGWRRRFRPLRRRFSELAEIGRSTLPHAKWEKEYFKLQRDVERFISRFEMRDPWTQNAGVNPWDLATASAKDSADGWKSDLSLKLSTVVKLGVDFILSGLSRTRTRPLPALAARVGRLGSLSAELKRVFGREWSSDDSANFGELAALQDRQLERYRNMTVTSLTTSRPRIEKGVFQESPFNLESLMEEFIFRSQIERSGLGKAKAALNIGLISLEDGALRRGEFYLRTALSYVPKTRRGEWKSVASKSTAALGRLSSQVGAIENAVELFDRAVTFDKNNAWTLNEYGAFLSSQENPKAIAVLKRALASDPTMQEAWLNLSSNLFRSGKLDEAIGCLERAVEIPGENSGRAFEQLGAYLGKAGKSDRAAEAYRQAANLLPNNDGIWVGLALNLACLGDGAGADHACSEANRLNPSRLQELQWREFSAQCAVGAGNYAQCAALLRPLLRSDQVTATVLLTYALAMEGLGDLAAARTSLRKAHRINPEDTDSLIQLIKLERRANDPKAGLRAARLMVKAFPGDESALAEEGDALFGLGRWKAALGAFRKADRNGFRAPRKYYGFALNLEQAGELALAIEFHRLEVAVGDHAPSYANMAVDQFELGEVEAAIENARRAVQLEPLDPINLHTLATIHLVREEYDRATPLLRQILSLENPPDLIRETAASNLAAIGGEQTPA